MNRRRFIATGATLPLLGGSIAAAQLAKDPHPELLDQWRRAKQIWSDADPDTPEEKAAEAAYSDAQMKLMTTPAQTPRGIAAQLEYALEDQLVGGAFGLEFSGLDDAMFRQMQQTLSALS
ncbi:MAG: hypothetical protein MRY81_10075 [Donghicola eburneus]|jgi:hypothetical protein|nr:hypothetical protein [Donghicola eburneus]MCI5040019.1 hypothetical protein [Donghicola eburneus]